MASYYNFHKIGITIIIRGITRIRPRIEISSIRVVTKIVPVEDITTGRKPAYLGRVNFIGSPRSDKAQEGR